MESGRLTQAELDNRKGLLDVLEFDDDSPEGSPQAGTSKDFMEGGRPPLPSSTRSRRLFAASARKLAKKGGCGDHRRNSNSFV